MATFIKTTQDGRRVEVIGAFVCLDGKPESWEVVDLITHPRRFQVLATAADATHLAGRIALTRDEAQQAREALWDNEGRQAANPSAVAGRFQAAMHRRAYTEGIE